VLNEVITDGLAALGVTADPQMEQRLGEYAELVERFSKVLNLTGIRGLQSLIEEFVLESAGLLCLGEIPAGSTVVDLGSGAGSPVIPLAILCPEAKFTAVEARARRVDFLRMTQMRLKLTNLSVEERRVETLFEEERRFDMVTGRAYAAPDNFVGDALRLLAKGGEIRGYTGAEPEAVLSAAEYFGLDVVLQDYLSDGRPRHIYKMTVPATGGI
jgi:16S rRNA (guanine527-N7)-methyltransferase